MIYTSNLRFSPRLPMRNLIQGTSEQEREVESERLAPSVVQAPVRKKVKPRLGER